MVQISTKRSSLGFGFRTRVSTRYTLYLLQQMLGRLRDLDGRCTILVNRSKLEVLARGSDKRIAEVILLLLNPDFPECLYNVHTIEEKPVHYDEKKNQVVCIQVGALGRGAKRQFVGGSAWDSDDPNFRLFCYLPSKFCLPIWESVVTKVNGIESLLPRLAKVSEEHYETLRHSTSPKDSKFVMDTFNK